METVLERVRDYLDDAGFVYVFEQQKEEFLHMLARSRLTFMTLHESELRVYPGKRLELPDGRIQFGYVMRKDEPLDDGVWELIRYLEQKLLEERKKRPVCVSDTV